MGFSCLWSSTPPRARKQPLEWGWHYRLHTSRVLWKIAKIWGPRICFSYRLYLELPCSCLANRVRKVLLTSHIRPEVLDLQISEKEDFCYLSSCLNKMENPAAILDIEDGTIFIFKGYWKYPNTFGVPSSRVVAPLRSSELREHACSIHIQRIFNCICIHTCLCLQKSDCCFFIRNYWEFCRNFSRLCTACCFRNIYSPFSVTSINSPRFL